MVLRDFLDKQSLFEKSKFYFERFFLNKNARSIKLLDMIIPVSEEKFVFHAQDFVEKIIKHNLKNTKKNVVIEQGVNFF